MANKGVAVNAFRVIPINKKSAPLEQQIEALYARNLEQRVRNVMGVEARLESLQKTNGYYLLDFARLRHEHGPGRASRKDPVKGFGLSAGECFGEETAALYVPKRRHLLVQYNHHGVRSGRLAQYLSMIDDKPDNEYSFELRYDEAVEQKLQRKKIIRSLHFKVLSAGLPSVDDASNLSVTSAVKSIGKEFGAETLDITISAGVGRKTSLAPKSVQEALKWLGNRLGVDAESVSAIDVTGKDDPDTKSELLHLLGHRLKVEFNDLKLDSDLRYPVDQRWYALERAYHTWKKTL